MSLTLFNTLTRSKTPFEPLVPDTVGLYVCGPTVYDFAHIGNARPVVVFDLLYRVLRRRFGTVVYVRNITDIDDKIIAAAIANGEPIAALTARTEAAFHRDTAALGALDPDHEPRATVFVPAMVAMIERLIAFGHAYPAEGHVLFHVPSMADYGRLSRRSRDELVAGARVEVAPFKRDPADFVLWKPSAADQPGWDSPWGYGRPGWHIECSAMASHHLGPTFDIHGGGLDLIFPHHENEIAQSQCAHRTAPFARYWLHNGFVTVDGEKMSKSLGNFFTVRQLLDEGWPGEAIRLTLLSAHYRQPLDFTRSALAQARTTLERWYGALRAAPGKEGDAAAALPDNVAAALDDDLNTPLAIRHLHALASEVHKADDPAAAAAAAARLAAGGHALGLLGQAPDAWATAGGAADGPPADEVAALIAERAAARARRDFAAADRIRDELAAQGIALEDRRDGPTLWRRG